MRVLFLSKYGSLAASTRYRSLQFFDYLRTQGIECELSALFDDDYLTRRFEDKTINPLRIASYYAKRMALLSRPLRYDCAVLYAELFPYLPALAEVLLAQKIPYLYDMDDAFFHNYDQHRNPLVRMILGNKLRRVIRGASGVLAGNRYLADYALRSNQQIEIFPTVVDTDRYRVLDDSSRPKRPFTVGWIGSPSTAPYVQKRLEAIRTFCHKRDARLTLIGAGAMRVDGVPVDSKPWDEATEIEEIHGFDIGIMPLPDTRWSRGKCAFKLIQYMACGIPVIACPVGMNADLVRHGIDGFLADSNQEWEEALDRLWLEPELRREMGRNGRKRIEENYSLKIAAPRLANALRKAI